MSSIVKVESNVAAIIKATRQGAGQGLDKASALIQARTARNTPVDTGRLQRSWDVESPGELERNVGSEVEYAKYIEFGTKHMPARAPLTQAVQESKAEADRIMRDSVKTSVK